MLNRKNSFVLGVDLGEGGGWRSCFLSDIKKTCPLGFVACGLLLFWFCVNSCKVLFKTMPTQREIVSLWCYVKPSEIVFLPCKFSRNPT